MLLSVLSHVGSEVGQLSAQDFEKGEKIGRGSGGLVYKGMWKVQGMPVALKKLIYFESDVQGRKSLREVEILSKLCHPNVISYYGNVTFSDGYYMVLELAENGSLWDYFRKNPVPNLAQSWRWAREIATGVQYLHQQNCLHRDLKSSNVLLKEDLTAKIGDLATAKLMENVFESTIQSSRTGTFQWMSPEAIRGKKVSSSWDVYSYGILLWELLTHMVPFEHLGLKIPGQEFQLQVKITEGERPPIPDGCDPKLASLMQHCWDEKPENRPSITEVLKELEQGEYDH